MLSVHDGDLYPLKFDMLSKEKVWGGHKIAARYRPDLPADRLIGEIWVLWDQLAVVDVAWQGRTLAELVRDRPLSLLGSRLAAGQGDRFPLLVKILDARSTLSVQVHPDDAYAQAREKEPFGKAEVWYVLDAEPGARLIHGLNRPLTRDEAKQAITTGGLREVLDYVDVAPGDVIMNVPGTIHALGEGILLYELQQSSDLTYRLYDWDRGDPSRPLHIARSLDVANLEPYTAHKIEPIVLPETGGTRTLLCACRYFAAELLAVRERVLEHPRGICFHALTVLRGAGRLRYGPELEREVALGLGESLLVPAGLQEYELRAGGGGEPFVVVKAYVPDLLADVVLPLREQGVSEAAIVQLGGEPKYSDLGSLVR